MSESHQRIESFIAYWHGREGGQERANYALFLIRLCEVLDLPIPEAAGTTTENNTYVFERAVREAQPDGTTSLGRIDLYKRGCFVLEAKQSRQKGGKKEVVGQAELFEKETAQKRGKHTTARAWDVLMMNARVQAQAYARALPVDDGWPPFILVCDVGNVIEVYADFSGLGKNYSQFPDRESYRIRLDDLRDPKIRDRLRAVWTDPKSLDPSHERARATREIAERLAAVSKSLEKTKKYDAETVAMFLMRCLFTMFAQSVELLPKNSFVGLLKRCEADPSKFERMVSQLWQAMNIGDFAYAIEAQVKHFNGEFFAKHNVLPLGREEIGELRAAAECDWRDVDPSIFGTLLEQALDPEERKRLGAHYTPRAYVERLVVATVIEPLRAEWANVLSTVERQKAEGRDKDAIATVLAFDEKLSKTRVLDPACGTGNFLYVSLELMKRLEGEVLETLVDLGGQEWLRSLKGHAVGPRQFLGIEINPRAVAISELVLWIGYLQWHIRTQGDAPKEPILEAFHNIRHSEAVLTWDGWPVPGIKNGKTTYPNARRPEWPEAEFIVGNPPFIGGKDTGLYNVLEKLRNGAPPDALEPDDRQIFDDGQVLILKELHDRLDAEVARACGWPADLSDEEILVRLVALNKKRATEEAKGEVRWLRSEFQVPRFGTAIQKAELRADLASVDACLRIFGSDIDPATIKPKATPAKAWLPKGAGTRTALEILRETGEPMSSQELAACILQRFERPIEERALTALVRTVHSNFCRRRDGIVTFDKATYPGKWRLTSLPALAKLKE